MLTPFSVNNYGTKLQAYAVQTIFSQYEEVEIIRYVPDVIDRVDMKLFNIFCPTSSFTDVTPDETEKKLDNSLAVIRRKAISSFDSKLRFAPIIKGRYGLKNHSKQYTAVVCGSDQIWNPINLRMHIYMLEFVPDSVRRIACAPSFGVNIIPENLKQIYKKRIANIEFLSVRENSGCKIAEQFGRHDVFHSLDPTLIVEKNKWEELAKASKYNFNEPYIFCYFLGTREVGRNFARQIREATGYKIVNLPHFKTYVRADENFADIDLYDVDPIDFISLISKASIVVTDSFHGTAFSTIFEKNFFCVERHNTTNWASTNDRLHSYLKLLGLEDRMIIELEHRQLKLQDIQWLNPEKILKRKRSECNLFIESAVRGKRNGF